MAIIACLIARNRVVLAEYSPPGNNFPSIARKILQQISPSDQKKSYSHDGFNFHFVVENEITYLCMADQSVGYRIPYSFLYDLAGRFKANFGEKIYSAQELAFNDSFSRIIQERASYFSNDRNADKITKVKSEIEEAKNVMVKNIDKVLERGSKIEVLVDKTEDLQENSHVFSIKSKKLKRKMCWQNAKLTCILIAIVAIIVVAITVGLMFKFGVFDHHNSKHNTSGGTTTTGGTGTGGTTGTPVISTTKSGTTDRPTTETATATTGETATTGPVTTTGPATTTGPVTTGPVTTGGTTGNTTDVTTGNTTDVTTTETATATSTTETATSETATTETVSSTDAGSTETLTSTSETATTETVTSTDAGTTETATTDTATGSQDDSTATVTSTSTETEANVVASNVIPVIVVN